MLPSVWVEPLEAKLTMDWWFLQTKCVILQPQLNSSCAKHITQISSPSLFHILTCGLLLIALRTCRQTWETSSLDSGAHQWWQSESYHRWSHPTLQALPTADGSVFQTGSQISQKICLFGGQGNVIEKKKIVFSKKTKHLNEPHCPSLFQEDQLGLSLLTLEQLESDEMLQKISQIAQQTWRG